MLSYITKTYDNIKEAGLTENDAAASEKSRFFFSFSPPAVSAIYRQLYDGDPHRPALLSVGPFSVTGRLTLEQQLTQIPFH